MNMKAGAGIATLTTPPAYAALVMGIAQLPDSARHISARAVNAVMTANTPNTFLLATSLSAPGQSSNVLP